MAKKAKSKKGVKKISKKTPKNNKPFSAKATTGKQKFTPYGDRVIIKPISEEELNKTSSGIIIPETVSKEKPEQGRVVAVGEGRWENGKRIPLSVKVGDKVVFSRYGYDEVKLDGEEYYILKEDSILAILN